MSNATLKKARILKRDEFYTQYKDIQEEITHYKEFLKGKTILCNCDNYRKSNFFLYFYENFDVLGIKRLESISYNPEDCGEHAIYNGKSLKIFKMKSDGDFRKEESIEILKNSDIVITNPPFSLLEDYIKQLTTYNKIFILLGSYNIIGRKDIFPLFKNDFIRCGVNNNKSKWFEVPFCYDTKTKSSIKIENNKKYIKLSNTCWFTNIRIPENKHCFILTKDYQESKNFYQKYDNMDAININKLRDIPFNYDGVMGVPITFMEKYNKEQFKIVGFRKGIDGKALKVNGRDMFSRILIKNIS